MTIIDKINIRISDNCKKNIQHVYYDISIANIITEYQIIAIMLKDNKLTLYIII